MAYKNKADTKRFMNLLGSVSEVFNKELSPLTINLYENILSEFPIEAVEKAFGKALTTCRFFPKPADIVDHITQGKKISNENIAELEAEKVLKHLRQYGSAKSLNAENPITNRLMSTRWQYRTWASQVLEKDLVWWKKEFIESFKSFSETDTALLENPSSGKVVPLLTKVGKKIA